MPLECFDGAKISYFFYISKLFRDFLAKKKRRAEANCHFVLAVARDTLRHSSLFTFHLPQASAFQFHALVAATVVAAALVVATLGDVLLARCSGSRCRVNLLPTHLVRELAAEGLARRPEGESQLGGYGATQSAPSVGSVQHLGGCHV